MRIYISVHGLKTTGYQRSILFHKKIVSLLQTKYLVHISSSTNFLIGLCLVVREGLTIERTIPHPNLYYDTLLLVCKNESVNQMKKKRRKMKLEVWGTNLWLKSHKY